MALKSIGCRSASERALGSEHPLMQGLIAMYVDLGNRLSLQYGGSEAHLKFEGFNNTKSALNEAYHRSNDITATASKITSSSMQ